MLVESEILGFGIRISAQGTAYDWNPESCTWNTDPEAIPESRIQDFHGFPYMGRSETPFTIRVPFISIC